MNTCSNKVHSPRKRTLELILFLLLIIGISGCSLFSEPQEGLSGRIILWHGWTGNESDILTRTIRQFEEVNPGLDVTVVSLPEEELLSRYQTAASDGLGPDLMIGSSEWTQELVADGDIRPLSDRELRSRNFSPVVAETVMFEDTFYGLPLFLFPGALYYNTKLSQDLPLTLTEMLEQAEEGKNVAFVPRFQHAHWGIQAFGQGLYDSEGNFTLAESGFTEWLTWLNDAQNRSGMILNIDETSLVELFAAGNVAYLVGDPDLLPDISSLMAEEDFNVALLPSGPIGLAGPLMPIETAFFNPASSAEQVTNASALALYLFSSQQSITFMRELNRVPANPAIQVDPRIYTKVVGFSEQAVSAVSLPNDLHREEFFRLGDQAYSNVLSGFLSPEEAVCRFGRQVVELQGYGEEMVSLPNVCRTNEIQEAS